MYQSNNQINNQSKSNESIKKIANVCSIASNECAKICQKQKPTQKPCRDLVNQNKNTGCGGNGGGDGWDDEDGTTWTL
jgi:hypothetical protein